jgi:hypothetical protein
MLLKPMRSGPEEVPDIVSSQDLTAGRLAKINQRQYNKLLTRNSAYVEKVFYIP